MVLNKNSLKSDAIGNLYRAAFYLVKGEKEIGIIFLKKAINVLGSEIKETTKLKPLLNNSETLLSTRLQQRYWAEKILDCYCLLK